MTLRWPWKSRNAEPHGGERALADAQRSLEETRQRWHPVLEAAEGMRELRSRNGFAESIELAYALKQKRETQ